MCVAVHAGTRATHGGLPGQVQRATGGVIGQLAIAGLGDQKVGLDEAAHLERGAGYCARGDADGLDALLAGRDARGLGGLYGLDLGDLGLRFGDDGLLLLLRSEQRLHLLFQLGDACFQLFFLRGLGEGHARCDQCDKQGGGQWPA